MRIETLDKNTNYNRYFIRFAYNGSPYFGFQRQPKQISVQETLETALQTILREKVKIVGAGRTDTGVHAKKMYAHFDFENKFPENLVNRLNSLLPWSISVDAIFQVKGESHARFDAVSRTYEYYISTKKDPFSRNLTWQLRKDLNLDAMNRACKILMEYDDFTSFAKLHTDNKTNICHMTQAEWITQEGRFVFKITANRFLRNMVRSVVGTMVDVGLGKLAAENLHEIIQRKDRAVGGSSAPACGLYLVDVQYDFL